MSSLIKILSLSLISMAALFVKVTANIFSGDTFFSFTRYAIRCVRVLVLPVPGPAMIISGPFLCKTAFF